MTKAPFRRRRPSVILKATRRSVAGEGRAAWPVALLAVLALLFAFSEVTLYDLVLHPLASLGDLAWGARSLVVTILDSLPYLLTAAALWLAGALTWFLLGPKLGARS